MYWEEDVFQRIGTREGIRLVREHNIAPLPGIENQKVPFNDLQSALVLLAPLYASRKNSGGAFTISWIQLYEDFADIFVPQKKDPNKLNDRYKTLTTLKAPTAKKIPQTISSAATSNDDPIEETISGDASLGGFRMSTGNGMNYAFMGKSMFSFIHSSALGLPIAPLDSQVADTPDDIEDIEETDDLDSLDGIDVDKMELDETVVSEHTSEAKKQDLKGDGEDSPNITPYSRSRSTSVVPNRMNSRPRVSLARRGS